MNEGKTRRGRINPKYALHTALMLAVTLCMFMPFYLMLIMSTYSTSGLYKGIHLLPGADFVRNVGIVLGAGFLRYYFNSFVVAASTTILSVLVSMMCGYALAKYSFRGRNGMFLFVMITMMIPTQVGLVGFVIEMRAIGWLGTYLPLIVPASASAFGVFWMRQFAASFIPTSVMESARIDGCGEFRTFFGIVVPMCKPAVITLAILSFVASWNNYLTPLIVINKQAMYTMPIAISTIGSLFYTEYAARIAALAIGTLPILVIFALGSKHFIQGMVAGAVKG